ncbi:MAG: RNA polymerase factor sigma-32 [Bdellovibrionaceae bacterium]|nr:RNA polymerase factor sigma-32 [Pseudobdellovibrionaceae bacterium]
MTRTPKPQVKARAERSSVVPASNPVALELRRTKDPKSVVAEIVDDGEAAHSSMERPEADRVYAVPSDEEVEHELGIVDDLPAKGLVKSGEASRSVRSTDPLAIYLSDIRKYPVLTKEQEQEVAKKFFETKDPEAAQILVKSNLRFVVKIAAEYSKFGAKMIDLVQEGNVGLMHAVRDYNPYKGARLITYAVWWIRGYIQEYLMRQYSMVRIGTTQNQRKLFYQLQKQKDALDALGNESSLAQISSRMDIPLEEVEQMAQRMSGRDVSLDRPLDDDSSSSMMDFQKDNSEMSVDEKIARDEQLAILREKISEIRHELSERELIILDERILNEEPLTLQEIGEKHGITREAVRQMEVRVMKKIRAKMDPE